MVSFTGLKLWAGEVRAAGGSGRAIGGSCFLREAEKRTPETCGPPALITNYCVLNMTSLPHQTKKSNGKSSVFLLNRRENERGWSEPGGADLKLITTFNGPATPGNARSKAPPDEPHSPPWHVNRPAFFYIGCRPPRIFVDSIRLGLNLQRQATRPRLTPSLPARFVVSTTDGWLVGVSGRASPGRRRGRLNARPGPARLPGQTPTGFLIIQSMRRRRWVRGVWRNPPDPPAMQAAGKRRHNRAGRYGPARPAKHLTDRCLEDL